MTAPSNANTSGLEVVAFLMTNRRGHTSASTMPPADGGDVTAYEPLVTAASAQARIAELRAACFKQDDAICQVLGAALGYPRYVDDQVNFPGSIESDGVCVGEHVAETIAEEAARRIAAAEARADRLAKTLSGAEETARRYARCYQPESDGRNTFLMLADHIAALQQETQP